MTYQYPDRNQPRISEPPSGETFSLTSEEAEVIDAAGDAREVLTASLRELRPPIYTAAYAEQEAATASVTGTREFVLLSGAGAGFRGLRQKYDAEIAATDGNSLLSPEGKGHVKDQAKATLQNGIERIADLVLSKAGDSLLAQFPSSPMAILSPDVAPMATFIVSSADIQLPATLLGKGADTLRRASDPVTPPAEQVKLNQLLDAAYLPLCERYSSSPPRHWNRWSAAAADLAELIRLHIDTTWKRPRYRAAVDAVSTFRADFTWIVTAAEQNGAWDDVLLTGAPSFAAAAAKK